MNFNTNYYHTAKSVREYIELAKDVNGKDLIDQLEQFLPKGSSLLEIGSGPGTDYQILAKIYRVIGSDYSEEFLKHLRKMEPKGTFLHLNGISLRTTNTFDGIYSNKVMHHFNTEDLMKSVKNQSLILSAEGVVCHSFWKGEGEEIFNGIYVNYHSEHSLREIFDEFFKILLIAPYKEFEVDDSLLLIAKRR